MTRAPKRHRLTTPLPRLSFSAAPDELREGVGRLAADWQIFTALIFGSIPGILAGSYAAAHFPERALRIVLALTLLAVATKLSFELIPSRELVAVQAAHH